MYPREFPITPSQDAVTGALSIYVEGAKKDKVRQMLFGLSVLRHATEEQLAQAMPLVELSQRITKAAIQELLAQ
jgi:hypothetical protein